MLIDYRYKNGANQNLKISNNERHNDKKYCIKCNKQRKLKTPPLSKILYETLLSSVICGKCGSNNDQIFYK